MCSHKAAGRGGGSSTSAIGDVIIDFDDAALTPGRDRRDAVAVVFALCLAVSSAVFGRDDSVSIERALPTDASRFASATDGRVTLLGPRLPVHRVSSMRALIDATYVFDSTGRVLLFVLDRNGRVINVERGSVR